MKLLLYSFLIALVIPLFSFSVEPKNPLDSCDRFILEADKKSCQDKIKTSDVDWYASSLCEKIDDDKIFLSCFDSIKAAQFDPRAIDICESMTGTDDNERLKCINMVKNRPIGKCKAQKDLLSFENCMQSQPGRLPASEKTFFQK